MYFAFTMLALGVGFNNIAFGNFTPANCDAKPMEDYDLAKSLGQPWYVYSYYSSPGLMPKVDCMSRLFTSNDDGSITINIRSIDRYANHKEVTSTGIENASDDNQAVIIVKDSSETHIVVDSDYDNYEIIVNCVTVIGVPGYITIVTTRTREVNNVVRGKINAALKKVGYPKKQTLMRQKNC